MSTQPKRKRLEKTVEPAPVSNQKFYCCRCGLSYSRQKGYFPVSHSPMYRGAGYVPMCCDCVDELYEFYKVKLCDDREAMRRVCMKLDLYWSNTIYDAMEKTVGVHSRVRNYIGKTNLIRYIDKTFDDTIKEEMDAAAKNGGVVPAYGLQPVSEEQRLEHQEEENESEQPSQEMIDFWGPGFKNEFYYELDRRYQTWTKDMPDVSDPTQMALYRQICLLDATISRDSAQGKAIDRNVTALNTILGSMNLRPAQKKDDAANAVIDNTPFGVWIRRWEDMRPVPEPDEKMKDTDGIIKYVSAWLYGHLAKMLGIKNTHSKLYEDEIARYRVDRPEYDDEDEETMMYDVLTGVSDISSDKAGG